VLHGKVKAGKNPSGGLNAKGRASYNKETGGHLRLLSLKVGQESVHSVLDQGDGLADEGYSQERNGSVSHE
jgi:hypothetical protein